MEYLNRKAPEPVELGKKMVKGPYQDKEGKEETESMKAEDDVTGPPLCVTRPQTELVMEGKPISAADELDNDVAGQRGSDSKRIESLAGGDQTELVMDGKPFPTADELDNDVAGQRGSDSKRIESLAGGDQTELVMDGKPFPTADELDNDVADQRGSDSKRIESLAGGDQTELVMDGKPFPTADELDNDVAGQRGSATKRIESLAGGDQTELVMDGKPFPTADELDNDVAGQRGSDSKRIESLAGGDQTELVMDGKPFPTADELDNDVAGQRGSATKRIESSAGGYQNELVMDGKPFSAEDELDNDMAGQHGPETNRIESLAGGEQIELVMDGKPFSAADEFNNVVPAQRGPETERMESSAGGDGPCSPNTAASRMGRERPTAHHEGVCDLPHQRRTRKSESRKSAFEYLCNIFGTRSAAAVWIIMALTVATSSLAGAECIGTEVKLDKGEAVLRCPLPVDVSDTGQAIIVKHFPETGSDPETVMYCFGPTKEAVQPECGSSNGFSLVAPLTDQVLAKVPVSRLMDSGAYKCQLYPLGDHRYFIPCHIHRFSVNAGEETAGDVPVTQEGQRSADTYTPVVSAATKGRKPGKDPPNREAPPCVGQSSSVGLTAAVLVLQVIIFILLLVNVFCLQSRNRLRAAGQRTALSPVVV